MPCRCPGGQPGDDPVARRARCVGKQRCPAMEDGKAFGGQIMAWTDMCGGICSMRHSAGTTVTAALDDLQFERPILIGDMVTLEGRVNATFRTSMEVEVTVHGENPATGARWRCVEALMTFVAIDELGRARGVPPLKPESEDDAQRIREATARRDERLARRKPR
jgi:acyl-CoA hydrolase